MSSLVANKRVLPADSDTPDVDDGDTTVSAGDFWPVIKLADLRLAARITGGITTSRLMHVTTEAVAHVTAQLLDWRAGQVKAVFTRWKMCLQSCRQVRRKSWLSTVKT